MGNDPVGLMCLPTHKDAHADSTEILFCLGHLFAGPIAAACTQAELLDCAAEAGNVRILHRILHFTLLQGLEGFGCEKPQA